MPLLADPRIRFRLWAFLATSYWLLLATATHLPPRVQPPTRPWLKIPNTDKLIHLSAFAVLALLLAKASDARARFTPEAAAPMKRMRRLLLAIGIYAFFDEVLQPLTDRYCDPWDWVADVTGAALGFMAYHKLLRR